MYVIQRIHRTLKINFLVFRVLKIICNLDSKLEHLQDSKKQELKELIYKYTQQILQGEIQYLLENDFIETSKSEWSSQCILFPKPD